MHEAQLSRLQMQRVRDRLLLLLRPILNHCVLWNLYECAELEKALMMETYGSAHPERVQIGGSGFLNVRDFDGSALFHDESNHKRKIRLIRTRPSPKYTEP